MGLPSTTQGTLGTRHEAEHKPFGIILGLYRDNGKQNRYNWEYRDYMITLALYIYIYIYMYTRQEDPRPRNNGILGI